MNQKSYEPPTALHKGKLEHCRSSEFMAKVHRFELCLSAKRVMPVGKCSPNDLQVHTNSSRVALAKMTVTSVCENSLAFEPFKYWNIGVKIQCYLFVYGWIQ